MDFAKLLKPEAVKVLTAASSKKHLLPEIGDLMSGVYGLNTGIVVESLLARENLGPTGVGNGVALPQHVSKALIASQVRLSSWTVRLISTLLIASQSI